MDQDVDAPFFPEPPADDPVLEGYEANQDNELGEGQDEVHNNTSSSKPRWRDSFPHPAGKAIRKEPTAFRSLHDAQVAGGRSIWGAFSDEGDWDFAQWILRSGITHASIDDLLELK
jgi:hypothetical protein